jgi:hypothetical protein
VWLIDPRDLGFAAQDHSWCAFVGETTSPRVGVMLRRGIRSDWLQIVDGRSPVLRGSHNPQSRFDRRKQQVKLLTGSIAACGAGRSTRALRANALANCVPFPKRVSEHPETKSD